MNSLLNSLGINKKPQDTRVVVAMSGGVDSSVAAALLAEQGYQTIGVTLQLYDQGEMAARKGACCAGQDIYDAKRVAEQLGIDHYVFDYESRFRNEVMEAFAQSYLNGETPVPCVLCNKTVKFRDLLQTARDLGADALATGHYVRRRVGINGPELLRGADGARDQSYFLFATTLEQLDLLRFPVGELDKKATRAIAERLKLPVAAKPDSQDICFVPNGDYASVVQKLRPEAMAPGEIVHTDGPVLGRHAGIINFTVGQRRGLGIGGWNGDASEPLFVLRIEPATRRVIVGPRAALAQREVLVREWNWLGDAPIGEAGLRALVRLRSSQALAPASLFADNGGIRVVLDTPAHGVAPGQACVAYDFAGGERVLGGGWIKRFDAGVNKAAAA
ncbi:MAG: tRNA 2-thiouridine(34) synthase MnmA [Rhodospirillales bacterium]